MLIPLGCLPRGAERRLDAALRELARPISQNVETFKRCNVRALNR